MNPCDQDEYFERTGKDCKSSEEIKDFVARNSFYMVAQTTRVGKDIYFKDADPYFCDGKACTEKTYFPLIRSHESLLVSNVIHHNDYILDAYEVLLGIDEIQIDDSLLGSQLRKRTFMNIK